MAKDKLRLHPATLPWLLILMTTLTGSAAERRYQLNIARQNLDPAGKLVPAMTINGGIPGPVLQFTEGDTAVIEVTNSMDTRTSVHWHGMLVPPGMDGVPGISFAGIPPHSSMTYRFPIRQSGTYWYHSHSGLQEQMGLYGSIAIDPRGKARNSPREKVVLLSDWTNHDPHQIMRLLRRGSEYMGIRKGTAQSLLGAVKTGKFVEFWQREAMRMPAMDLADVAYDAFLTNGSREDTMAAKPGETVRLRIIDGSASTYFHLRFAGGPLRIIAADGQPVTPLLLKKPLLMGVAETYDVLVTLPSAGAWELRATAHDGSGHTSLWIGGGERHPAPDMAKPYVYDTMNMFGWRNMFALTPAGTMGMPDGKVKAGNFDQPGMNMQGMAGMGKMDGQMDMGAMPGMRMSMKAPAAMDHSEMDHSGMQGMEMEIPPVMDSNKPMDHSKMGIMDTSMDRSGSDSSSQGMPGRESTGGGSGMPGHSMHGMEGGVIKRNPARWYDFLLGEDAASAPLLASDGMMSASRPFAPYPMLQAVRNTALPENAPHRTVRLTLDGDMTRYVWMLNSQELKPENTIRIRKGEVVRFIYINRTMMHHPMHLHGHFFRVINGQGARSPLKHTVDVEPMSTTVIEFEANEMGDWFFHCHLLYHMMSGMARVIEYEGYTADPATQDARASLYHDPWYFYGSSDLLSNESQGSLWYSDIRNTIGMNYELGWQGVDHMEWETDITYSRYLNRFTSVFAGVYGEGIKGNLEQDRLIAGLSYLLPGNFRARAWADSDGGTRFTIDRQLMLTPRLGVFGEAEYDSHEDWSYQGGASYILNQAVSVTALWDSKFGVGAGLTLRF